MTTSVETLDLTTAIASYPHTEALRQGHVGDPRLRLHDQSVMPIIAAYRRMIRSLEFDVCEMAPTTYFMAREAGVPIVALPIVLMRKFHHRDLVVPEGSSLRTPADLRGTRVGVRAYSVTTGVWVRQFLKAEWGIEAEEVTWVVDDEDHVAALMPPNVVRLPEGGSIAEELRIGGIDAALTGAAGVGRAGPPGAGWESDPTKLTVRELVPHAAAADMNSYVDTGVYPLHGVVVVKSELLESSPWVAQALFDIFVEAKKRAGEYPGSASFVADLEDLTGIVGQDPYPYGLEANRISLEALIEAAHDQRLIASRPPVEELFVPIESSSAS